MPLFSSKGDESEQDVRPELRDSPEEEGERPPDEYTRLLPNRVNSNRDFLSPDDPAVSPYNLFSIRFLRYVTLFFTALTFLWWVILLVSAFATPPGFHTKGSGFFAFGYTSLTLSNMFFTLLFFGVPSKSVRILAIVIAVSPINCYSIITQWPLNKAIRARLSLRSIRSSSPLFREQGMRKGGSELSVLYGLS